MISTSAHTSVFFVTGITLAKTEITNEKHKKGTRV